MRRLDIASPRVGVGSTQSPILANSGQGAAPARSSSTLPEHIFVRTKTRVPDLCEDTLPRERLAQLSELVTQRLLTLVVAPPGCGKTTLAGQWGRAVAARGIRVGWLSIDADDDDPARFLSYLCQAVYEAGFRGWQPGVGEGGVTPAQTALTSALINAIAEDGHELLLILDNYAWIADPEVHQQISFILDNAPINLHLVVLTRTPPPLSIGSLRARNQLLELDVDAIRFSRTETFDLLQMAVGGPIPYAHLRELYELTHGWAAAVRIACLTIVDFGVLWSVRREMVDSVIFGAIDQYLDELFANFPEALLRVMTETAIVDAVSLPLWRVLTDEAQTETYFYQLAQQQLLIPLSQERGLLTYPGLVRRHLRNRLATSRHGHAKLLHRRAYAWYVSANDWGHAVEHALAAGDNDLALQWMESNAMLALTSGNVGTLLKWHAQLEALALVPALPVRMAFAWAHAISHSLHAALEIVHSVESSFVEQPLPIPLAAECFAIRAMAYALADRIEEASVYAAQCDRTALADGWMVAAVTCIDLHHRFCRADWPAFFSEASAIAVRCKGEIEAQVFRLSELGLAALLRGQIDCAQRYCEDALRLLPTEDAREVFLFSAWPTGLLASIYHVQGRGDEVEHLLADRLDSITASGYLDCTLGAHVAVARARAAKGRTVEALVILEQAEAIACDNGWPRMEAAVLFERARIYVARSRFDEAQGCVLRLSRLAEGEDVSRLSPISTPAQFAALAQAYVGIYSGWCSEAIAPLARLRTQYLDSSNELLAVVAGTLLSIAYCGIGAQDEAMQVFRDVLGRAERGGFVSPVTDQGSGVGVLLRRFLDSGPKDDGAERLRRHAQRLLEHIDQERDSSAIAVAEPSGTHSAACLLTPKELEVLSLIAQGQSNKEIARNLKVAPETVKTHLKHIFAKLAVERRIHAIAKAQSLGLLT